MGEKVYVIPDQGDGSSHEAEVAGEARTAAGRQSEFEAEATAKLDAILQALGISEE